MKRMSLLSGLAGLLLASPAPPGEWQVPCIEGLSCARLQAAVAANAPASPPAPALAIDLSVLLTETSVTFPPPIKAAAAPAPVVPPKAEVVEAAASEPPQPQNGVRILISIPQQKAYVFEDGELIDTSPVSTGKRGHETPTGTFPILQKKVHHRSNKYANAPMPYMQRLTWQGVALHAGSLPGYPASHGCIRLPRKFAKKLYNMTDYGTVVTITREKPKSADAALELI